MVHQCMNELSSVTMWQSEPEVCIHRDPGLQSCKWARRTFDSAQNDCSRALCALFAVQPRWRAPYHIEAYMNRMSRKRAFQRSEDCWEKASIRQPDFTSALAGTGHLLLFLFVAIAAITFTAVQWRLANGLANLQVTVFCERARQCS